MGMAGLDTNEQLKWLQNFRHEWGQTKEGKVRISPGHEIWFDTMFRVLHYRVWLSIIVGPRGGLQEQATVVDDRPKQTEIEHLFLVQILAPMDSETFVVNQISRVNRKSLDEARIVKLLEAEYLNASQNPDEYARRICLKEITGSTSYHPKFVVGGMSMK